MKTTIVVDDEVYERFRLAVRKKHGRLRNKLMKAVEEALRDWTNKVLPSKHT